MKIEPKRSLYIKLGRSGSWEQECLKKGILRFGYKETPFKAATSGDWDTVLDFWRKERGDKGAATRDVIQIRHFFEADEQTVWITFSAGTLWWCFAREGVRKHQDGKGSYRTTVDGWHNKDVNGALLSSEKVSGNLLKIQGFHGTICEVKDFEYLKRKINGFCLPEVEEARRAENVMLQKIVPLMRLLTWKDFELLVDLVFASSGWRRIGQVGKTQKTVDLDLVLPTTGERALVQIKSFATRNDLEEYLGHFQDLTIYDRMFFVWHSGDVGEVEGQKVVLVGPAQLARMIFEAGLTSWLREKVS